MSSGLLPWSETSGIPASHDGAAAGRGLAGDSAGRAMVWPTRPIRVCWPRRSSGSRSPAGGSRPPVARSAHRGGTGPGRPGNGPTGSRRSWAMRRAATRRRRLSNGSPVNSPTWPRPQPRMRRGCCSTPGGLTPRSGQGAEVGRHRAGGPDRRPPTRPVAPGGGRPGRVAGCD